MSTSEIFEAAGPLVGLGVGTYYGVDPATSLAVGSLVGNLASIATKKKERTQPTRFTKKKKKSKPKPKPKPKKRKN